ncbi:MAG: pilus (MSHA type) biogenesis protein MshL [Magnetococcales bacterium]|nr:pilus (MSHA type) biogenesis protein MshL [Magnetococcales bacterium]
MNKMWALGGMMALSVIGAGCQTTPQSPDSESDSTASLLRKSHESLAKQDKGLGETRNELIRDLKLLYGGSPSRGIHEALTHQSREFEGSQNTLLRDLEKRSAVVPEPEPVLPEYNPLDDVIISLEMDKEDVRNIFRALAKMTEMNLMIHPSVLEEPPVVTVSFHNMEASAVFREILELADLHGTIEGNLLRVTLQEERTFTLNFLDTKTTANFSAGGDVLGGASAGEVQGGQLSGNFSMSGSTSEANPYTHLQTILASVLEGKGSFTLNNLSGLLHIKARPSAMRRAVGLLQQFREIVDRQILIEARIMEVQLNDEHQSGIDWAFVRKNLYATRGQTIGLGSTLGTAPWSSTAQLVTVGGVTALTTSTAATTSNLAGLGLTLAGKMGNVTLQLLKQFGDVRVLSNPSIRARHGQPAMISVGRANAYVEETDTTTTAGGGTTTVTVDVQTNNVFDGLMIGVVPFIGQDGEVTLAIHPVKSDVLSTSLALQSVDANGTVKVTLPQVDLKELSTTLKMRNEDTVLLGGLIDKTRAGVRTGVPVLSELPLLGRLFTKVSDNEEVRELVIMLRVSVL